MDLLGGKTESDPASRHMISSQLVLSSFSAYSVPLKESRSDEDLLPVSHRFPVNPCWQTQLLGETQVPPFWHNPSHIAGSGAGEENHYSPRRTSFNYVIRPAPECGFACRIRANSVT